MQIKHNTSTVIAMYSGNNVAASISIVAAFLYLIYWQQFNLINNWLASYLNSKCKM